MLRPGQTLGPYRIGPLLGRGGMGTVYAGVRVDDNQPVAIKTLHTTLLAGSERDTIVQRFQLEADIGLQLRHPGIVAVHDHGRHQDELYLVMDRIDGEELRQRLTPDTPQPLAASLAIVLQLLNALAYAHGHGIVHRDIKPANILVRKDLSTVLTDFGIARLEDSDLTRPGELLGSPAYMAPEQIQGSQVDQRVDLYAVGVVLYQLLTGRKPFNADSLATLIQQLLRDQPPPPSSLNSGLPPALDGILARALAKRPEARFDSATAFAAVLREVEAGLAARDEEPPISPPLAVASRVAAEGAQPTEHLPPSDTLLAQLEDLLLDCLRDGASGARLQRFITLLDGWSTQRARIAGAGSPVTAAPLDRLLGEAVLVTLVERICAEAPMPGKPLAPSRGDWVELVRLFALLQRTAESLGRNDLAPGRRRIIDALARAVFDYGAELGRQLFTERKPPLTRISADFLRMEILQLGFEILGTDAEKQRFRQTLLLFAQQVMDKVNTLIRQALQDRTGTAGEEDIGHLLLEMEELIVLLECLLAWEIGLPTPPAGTPGGAVMAEFIDHARRLSRRLGSELLAQFEAEENQVQQRGPAAFESGQAAFVDRLRQLGMLYRLAVRLEPVAPIPPLQQLGDEVHHDLESISAILLAALEEPTAPGQRLARECLWQRLSVIDELAEQFGWPALHQQVVRAVRQRLAGG